MENIVSCICFFFVLKYLPLGGAKLSNKEKRIVFAILKLLYIFTIFCSLLALKLELGVYTGDIPRDQVDTTYMLDSIIASIIILGGSSFGFFKLT